MLNEKLKEYLKRKEEIRKNFIQELEDESPTIAKLFSQNENLEIVDAQDNYQIVKIDELPIFIISDNEVYKKVKSVLEKKFKPKKTYKPRTNKNSKTNLNMEVVNE